MGERVGGRAAGTPNKSTAKVKAFLDQVFEAVFAHPDFKQHLIEDIVSRRIDSKLLTTLLAYYAGRPAQQVDLRHQGTVSLAQLITGRIPADEEDSDGRSPDAETDPTPDAPD